VEEETNTTPNFMGHSPVCAENPTVGPTAREAVQRFGGSGVPPGPENAPTARRRGLAGIVLRLGGREG